jgi:hypothetical protein
MISTDSKIAVNDSERADAQAGKAAARYVAQRRARLFIGSAQSAQAR